MKTSFSSKKITVHLLSLPHNEIEMSCPWHIISGVVDSPLFTSYLFMFYFDFFLCKIMDFYLAFIWALQCPSAFHGLLSGRCAIIGSSYLSSRKQAKTVHLSTLVRECCCVNKGGCRSEGEKKKKKSLMYAKCLIAMQTVYALLFISSNRHWDLIITLFVKIRMSSSKVFEREYGENGMSFQRNGATDFEIAACFYDSLNDMTIMTGLSTSWNVYSN